MRTANDKLEGLVDHLKEFLLAEKHIESKVSYVCLLLLTLTFKLLTLESVDYSLMGGDSFSISLATKIKTFFRALKEKYPWHFITNFIHSCPGVYV